MKGELEETEAEETSTVQDLMSVCSEGPLHSESERGETKSRRRGSGFLFQMQWTEGCSRGGRNLSSVFLLAGLPIGLTFAVLPGTDY